MRQKSKLEVRVERCKEKDDVASRSQIEGQIVELMHRAGEMCGFIRVLSVRLFVGAV